MARYVDALGYRDRYTGALVAPGYIEMDLCLAWRPRKNLELAVVGQNLLDSHHYEFIPMENTFAPLTETPRSVYGAVTWRY
jgi:iron complex outermembrane receptor protein